MMNMIITMLILRRTQISVDTVFLADNDDYEDGGGDDEDDTNDDELVQFCQVCYPVQCYYCQAVVKSCVLPYRHKDSISAPR